VLVQVSGEELGTGGFLFPEGSEVVLADGWELRFDHVLVTVGNVTLSRDPDRSPSDASQVGAVVARAAGPWAVDLAKEGDAAGVGGEGTAVPLIELDGQTENGGEPFAADERYAFGYEVLAASAEATRVNLDGDAAAAYETMIERGYTTLFVGEATWKGTSCTVSDDTYDFAAVPTTLRFSLGFTTPAAFVNCQNQENQGDPFDGEEYQRGIATRKNASVTAQLTLHLDHPFYSDVEHEPALYFGQMAARLVGKPEGTVLTEEDLARVDPTAFVDGAGTALPWRVCVDSPLPEGTQMGFETGPVPLDPSAAPDAALRDYRDYVHYVASAMGHLNGGEGLCYVDRKYPSPR
jgi:hypothetical protein